MFELDVLCRFRELPVLLAGGVEEGDLWKGWNLIVSLWSESKCSLSITNSGSETASGSSGSSSKEELLERLLILGNEEDFDLRKLFLEFKLVYLGFLLLEELEELWI